MERRVLWAPWRAEYVGGKREPGCIFCPPEEPLPDEERLILYRDERVLVLMNKFPYNTGHLLVSPRRHVADLEDLSREEITDLMVMAQECLRILRRVLKPDGFNVGFNLGKVAGAGYPDHLHLQIVPRWEGDANFLAVLADLRMIPEHLLATYRKLYPHFERLKNNKK
ncbi:MAG TPA: HIT domain-containing protein [Thermosulfurimonas dismutans]|uniref:HIT domain-containing protein n=1 Tax=Thermosulfurimonas dismutans TaxID=999894 RepID=A0A7C3GQN7_9BACT|nr:HIT domain-containing protein [Thermosulfurimonas dismutans]